MEAVVGPLRHVARAVRSRPPGCGTPPRLRCVCSRSLLEVFPKVRPVSGVPKCPGRLRITAAARVRSGRPTDERDRARTDTARTSRAGRDRNPCGRDAAGRRTTCLALLPVRLPFAQFPPVSYATPVVLAQTSLDLPVGNPCVEGRLRGGGRTCRSPGPRSAGWSEGGSRPTSARTCRAPWRHLHTVRRCGGRRCECGRTAATRPPVRSGLRHRVAPDARRGATWRTGRGASSVSRCRSHRPAMISRQLKTARRSTDVHMGRLPGESHAVHPVVAAHRTTPAA